MRASALEENNGCGGLRLRGQVDRSLRCFRALFEIPLGGLVEYKGL
jgi:hypothetical protein